MRILKGIISVILSLALLFTAGLTMGLNAAEKAVNAEAIKSAMTDTAIVEDLVEEALTDSAAGLDGIYGSIAQDVLESDALMDFLSGYLAASISSELYGEESENLFNEDVLYEDLINSFSQEFGELAGLEGYDLSQIEEDYIQQTIESELPEITAEIDEQIGNYESSEEDMFIESIIMSDVLQAMMAKGFRTLLTIVSVIIGIAVIALGWRGKLGILWCTIVMGLISMVYVTMSLMGESIITIMDISGTDEVLLNILMQGLGASAKTGFVITAVLLAAFIILRLIDTRRNRHEENFETSERYA